jgi:hypothetical protein
MQQINNQWISQVMQDLEEDDVKWFNETIDKISERAKNFNKNGVQ